MCRTSHVKLVKLAVIWTHDRAVRGRGLILILRHKLLCIQVYKECLHSLFSNSPQYTLFAPKILHKLLFSNALGDTAYSQEHLKTMVYAKFEGQTKCIMGNSKIENFKPVCYVKSRTDPCFWQLGRGSKWLPVLLTFRNLRRTQKSKILRFKWQNVFAFGGEIEIRNEKYLSLGAL